MEENNVFMVYNKSIRTSTKSKDIDVLLMAWSEKERKKIGNMIRDTMRISETELRRFLYRL